MSSSRLGRVLDSLGDSEVDSLLVTDLADVRWLTGFTGTSGLVLCSSAGSIFVTDSRYGVQAADEVAPDFEVAVPEGDLSSEVGARLPGSGRLGFDRSAVTVEALERLESALPGEWEAVAIDSPVKRLRMVKDRHEIESIAAAARLADEVLADVLSRGLAGRAESEVAWDLERTAREHGAERLSFEPIVASGPRGALPHASPSDIPIPEGTLVVIDWGVVVDGYCSDCTRTVGTGQPGSDEAAVHSIVLEAQQAGLEALRPGRTGREVDEAARMVIEDAGFGEAFGHGLGHGVGLEIHEGPTLGKRRSDVELGVGMVVTIEPGIYLPGRFGVRIEELCVVEEEGPRLLTSLGRGIFDVVR